MTEEESKKIDALSENVHTILGYIESDPKTKRKGLFEQVSINTEDISDMKTDKKVLWGKVGVATFILGTLGGILGRVFFR